jgi:hypothetical protein
MTVREAYVCLRSYSLKPGTILARRTAASCAFRTLPIGFSGLSGDENTYGLFDETVRPLSIEQTSSVIVSLRLAATVLPDGLKNVGCTKSRLAVSIRKVLVSEIDLISTLHSRRVGHRSDCKNIFPLEVHGANRRLVFGVVWPMLDQATSQYQFTNARRIAARPKPMRATE